MADSASVSSLIQHLSRLLYDHVNLRSGIKDKIRSLRRDLEFMDVFLMSSEGKRNHHMVRVLVNQITDVAHEAEDLVDTYVANVSLQKGRNIVKKLLHCTSHEMMLRDVDAEIEKIKIAIDEIYKNKDRYGIELGVFQSGGDDEAGKEAEELLRRRRKDVEEEEVVGLVHDSGIVIGKLMETSSSSLNVVSIIGMGGLGKTTLARKIYNSDEVKGMFPCRSWGYVSNEYRAKELLLSLVQCLMGSTSEYKDLSEEELKKKVREYLNGKTYLIVLDDIWRTQVWDELTGAFPDDKNGSRVLITSRITEVATYTRSTLVHCLPLLNEKESWELFCKKVFPADDYGGRHCPSELKDLGTAIVERCEGLPLAIVVLAGLVSKKERTIREWSRIENGISWHLEQEDNMKVMGILKLSYNNLPSELKPCFLYLGMFPEDDEIQAKDLIQLWIAEGFIQPPKTGTSSNVQRPEDIAEYYLDGLVDRNLVQVSRRNTSGSVKTCRIHDLLRDLCISEADKAGKFFEVYRISHNQSLSNPRRLSIHCPNEVSTSSITLSNQSCTRSLLLFVAEIDEKSPKHIMKNLKLARVLSFGESFLRSVPSDLNRMIHLRYIRIHLDPSLEKIAVCVSDLWNLETLKIIGSIDTVIVIRGIWKLKQLRHVSVDPCAVLEGNDHEPFLNLQTLSSLTLDSQSVNMLNNSLFPDLRKLTLFYDFVNKQYLVSKSSREKYSARKYVRSLSSLPSSLRRLKIHCTAELPLDPNVFPSNLTKISLVWFDGLDKGCMSTLGQVINLQVLKLERQTTEKFFDLSCAAGEFQNLQEFRMHRVYVRSWKLEEGAMPRLEHLVIDYCQHLDELPDQLWSLSTLRRVHVIDSRNLAKNLQNVEVSNGCKLIISDASDSL